MSQLTQRVPVGFRFHPTDEELVGYYLPKKVTARKIDLDLIRDLDLYKLEPWDLQELCKIQADSNEKQTDYYFFSRKDKKYPTGNRANRATTKGFWKATGRDKPIHTKHQALIGMRKTLVFYQGRAPHGLKTDWIMHEFRLDDGPGRPAHEDGGWVVCRVFKKNKNLKMKLQERATVSFEEQMGLLSEPQGSPDILSGGGRFAYPDRSQYGGQYGSGIKQEIINLDDYQIAGRGQYVDNSFNNYAMPTKVEQQHPSVVHTGHSMPSSADARAYLARTLSLRRGDDFLNIPESPVHGFHEPGETSSGTSDGATTDADECGILGSLSENVDWSALYQDPPPKVINNPDSVLVHLKRTNSDIFSSMDLWNYTQITQGI